MRTLTLAVTFPTAAPTRARLAEVWGARVQQISREQHIDELMLLNHSEEFFENPEMVEFDARPRCSRTRTPSRPRRSAASSPRAAATTRATGSARSTMPTHVIGGERDILVPVWKSREIAALIPGAKLTVLARRAARRSRSSAPRSSTRPCSSFIREAAATPAA